MHAPHCDASQLQTAQSIATNVRRLMARDGLTFNDVVQTTGLDERTVRALVRGDNNSHARTLHKFAHGLGISIDELFQPAGGLPSSPPSPRQAFDRATNPVVESVVESHSPLFATWSPADFDELYSQFGAGGPLNETGVLAAAETINTKRDVCLQISVIFESGDSELLTDFVRLLYRRVTENNCRPVGAHRLSDHRIPGVPTPGY